MHLKFLGAAETVTGSKYLLTAGDKKILIDCGLFQGEKDLRKLNWEPLAIDPKTIDIVVITHAHVDHTGYLPLLVKNGFTGRIYATKATYDLCSILLQDSAHLQEEEAYRANKYGYSKHKPALPLYTKEDASIALEQFEIVQYDKKNPILPNGTITWRRAGHILGSAFIEIEVNNKKIVFSGDLGRQHDIVMRPPEAIEAADYVVLESTYGDRLHDKTDPLIEIAKIINQTYERDGTTIIPAFAVARSQALLYILCELKRTNKIPNVPVYLDSPMGIDATELMCGYPEEQKINIGKCGEICDVAIQTYKPEQSKLIDNDPFPKIIISSSGMLEGGRVLFHLKAFADDAKNTILFTGYQANGTRGAKIIDGAKEIKFHGEMIQIKAQVENITSLSAHADYEEILYWLKQMKKLPKKIFLIHGEKKSSHTLKKYIERKLGVECVVPKYLEVFDL